MCCSHSIAVSLLQLTCSAHGQSGMAVVLLEHFACHNRSTDSPARAGARVVNAILSWATADRAVELTQWGIASSSGADTARANGQAADLWSSPQNSHHAGQTS